MQMVGQGCYPLTPCLPHLSQAFLKGPLIEQGQERVTWSYVVSSDQYGQEKGLFVLQMFHSEAS